MKTAIAFDGVRRTGRVPRSRSRPARRRSPIEIGGKPFGDFYVAGKDVTKPYLWPLRAASGTYVTRAFPMQEAADEKGSRKDHLHQRGLWLAHEVVTPASTGQKIDFWNNDISYLTTPRRGAEKDLIGKMTLKGPVEVKSGAKQGTHHRHLRLGRGARRYRRF